MTLLRKYKSSTSIFVLITIFVTSITLFYAPKAEAGIFGGAAGSVIPCFNAVIWTSVSAPRGGQYIWAPGVTRTYEYGPPAHSGQWLLGLYGAPYFCIVSPLPLIIFPGLLMTMLGSSQ